MTSPRILVGSPVYSGSWTFFNDFLNAWRQLSYRNASFCIVENNTAKDDQIHVFLEQLKHVRRDGDLEIASVRHDDRVGWDSLCAALNEIREVFLAGEYEYLFINETSRPCPPDVIERLAEYRMPAIGAIYKSSYHPGYYCVYDFDERMRSHANDAYARVDLITRPTQVPGIGFGALLIHRAVLEKIAFRCGDFAPDTYFSSDLKAWGIPLYAAPIIVNNLKHRDEKTRLQWQQRREELLAYLGANEESSGELACPLTKLPSKPFESIVWDREIRQLREDLRELISADERAIVVPESIRCELPEEILTMPFVERDGVCWGPPNNDDQAIQELERLRDNGAGQFVVAWPAFWWLRYYLGFHNHLRSRYCCRMENERVAIFSLTAK